MLTRFGLGDWHQMITKYGHRFYRGAFCVTEVDPETRQLVKVEPHPREAPMAREHHMGQGRGFVPAGKKELRPSNQQHPPVFPPC
jgi:hypothetical protein